MTISNLIKLFKKNENDLEILQFVQKLGNCEHKIIKHLIYFDYPLRGICLQFYKNEGLTSIFLYSEGYENHRAFMDEMPNGMTFNLTREEVKKKFPVVLGSGGGKMGMLGKIIKYWDKFCWEDTELTVQYSDNLSSIELVSIRRNTN